MEQGLLEVEAAAAEAAADKAEAEAAEAVAAAAAEEAAAAAVTAAGLTQRADQMDALDAERLESSRPATDAAPEGSSPPPAEANVATSNEVRNVHAHTIPIPAPSSLYELLLTSHLVALHLLTFRWKAARRMRLQRWRQDQRQRIWQRATRCAT